RLRYKIFGEELAYINREDYPDMLEKDDFDELDTTTNFVVMKNHETVGAVRLIENTGLPFNIERYVDINSLKEDKNINLAEASRFCIRKSERLNVRYSFSLCKLIINYAISRGVTDIVVLSNSTKSKEGNTIKYFNNVGFYQFSDEIYYEKFNEYAIPLRLNLKKISAIMMDYLKKRTSYIEKPYDTLNLDYACGA
ncbi:MAG: GNAT family N-acetyltransferase, partial [Planctomycetes bacterium]|nr:GNAT family N-acetyltransferase [Planctomycetota bacterium]